MNTGTWLRAVVAATLTATLVAAAATMYTSPIAAATATSVHQTACPHYVASDFNGDGHADAAVMQTNPNDDDALINAVNVVYGTSSGLTAAHNLLVGPVALNSIVPAGTTIGMASYLTSGDFNGDCIADLAVSLVAYGSPSDNTAGGVLVLYGAPAGLSVSHHSLISMFGVGTSPSVLAAGDFNNDGYDDLAAGSPNSGDFDGAVGILSGAAGGLGSTAQIIDPAMLGLTHAQSVVSFFGGVLAAGDFDGDGRADLAIGAPDMAVGKAQDAGQVIAIYGSATGLNVSRHQFWTENSASVPGTAEQLDTFGSSLATGDTNKDGRADLVVGVPGEGIGSIDHAGEIIALDGSATGLTGTNSKVFDQNSPGIPGNSEIGDGMGRSLAIGDLNGDGYADVAIGVPNEDIGSASDAGFVNVVYGGPSGLTSAHAQGWSQDSAGVTGTSEAGDIFGGAVYIEKTASGTAADLVIGDWQESSSGHNDNGAIAVLRGSHAGVTATGNLFLDTSTLAGGIHDNEEFGSAIA